MNDAIEVTSEQYAEIVRWLDEARNLRELAKGNHLTLAQKRELLRNAQWAYDTASAIGRPA